MKEIIGGAITSPKGFKATGNFVGLKKAKKDLTLIASDVPAAAAACFTKNIVKAAPVKWCKNIMEKEGKICGIVINSGNANACTGEQGIKDTEQMAQTYASLLNASSEQVLVCSTGVIGVNLPIDKVTEGIKTTFSKLGSSAEDGILAAEGIITTDTFIKTIAVEFEIGGKAVKIGGIAKGSGMIHPNMATLLSFITTDANISKELLSKALTEIVSQTYNMISVDGDTSTNDTIIALANGLAENKLICTEDENYKLFYEALLYVNKKLAKDIAKDGEGATKLLEVNVFGASTKDDAVKIAKSVVSSSLFKAALFGEDANWGRVLCAMGYSEGYFNPDYVSIVFKSEFGEIALMDKGTPIVFDEQLAKAVLGSKEIFVEIYLDEISKKNETATAWGCDLTYDYVKINGDYRS